MIKIKYKQIHIILRIIVKHKRSLSSQYIGLVNVLTISHPKQKINPITNKTITVISK